MKGMAPTIMESAPVAVPLPVRDNSKRFKKRKNKECNKQKKVEENFLMLLVSDSYGGVDLFEGTSPAPAQQSPQSQAASPLGGVAPGDAGSRYFTELSALGGHKWKALI